MDYRISLPPPAAAMAVLRDLAAASGGAIADGGDGTFRIGPRAVLRADPADPQAAVLRPGDDAALFTLLQAYFARHSGPDAGLLVMPLGTPAPMLVAITDDPETDFGRTPIGFNAQAAELLASAQVFAAAWPVITGSDDAFEPFDEIDEEIVETGYSEDQMLLLPFLSDDPDLSQTVSFLIYGSDPRRIMRDILRVPRFNVRDPGFLTFPLPDPQGTIEAVSFGTGEGPVVELRVPLPARSLAAATTALAAAGRDQGATVLFVTDIIDEEETFIVQDIEVDGHLGAPRRIRMQ